MISKLIVSSLVVFIFGCTQSENADHLKESAQGDLSSQAFLPAATDLEKQDETKPSFVVKYTYINPDKKSRTEFSQTLGRMTYREAKKACSTIGGTIPTTENYNVIIKNLGGVTRVGGRAYDSYSACHSYYLLLGSASKSYGEKESFPEIFDDLPPLIESAPWDHDYKTTTAKYIYYWALESSPLRCYASTFNYSEVTETRPWASPDKQFVSKKLFIETLGSISLLEHPQSNFLEARCVRVMPLQ